MPQPHTGRKRRRNISTSTTQKHHPLARAEYSPYAAAIQDLQNAGRSNINHRSRVAYVQSVIPPIACTRGRTTPAVGVTASYKAMQQRTKRCSRRILPRLQPDSGQPAPRRQPLNTPHTPPPPPARHQGKENIKSCPRRPQASNLAHADPRRHNPPPRHQPAGGNYCCGGGGAGGAPGCPCCPSGSREL